MRTDAKTTLMASLIGSVAGTAAWLFGLADQMWPAHPQLAVFLFTVATTVIAMVMWPRAQADAGARPRRD